MNLLNNARVGDLTDWVQRLTMEVYWFYGNYGLFGLIIDKSG